MCSICHREHSPHSYTADNPGVCTVCGGVGVCNHPIGFTDNGDGTHKCNKCYGVMEHEYVSAPTETRCKQCACGAELAHTWENGVCTVCGYTCTHPNGFYGPHTDFHYCRICGLQQSHSWVIDGTGELCRHCTGCDYTPGHSFGGGDTCSVCGYKCTHPDWLYGIVDGYHVCSRCDVKEPHTFAQVHEDLTCLKCTVCGAPQKHTFPSITASACGTCSVCGDSFDDHAFNQYTGICNRCGTTLLNPDASYYVDGGPYEGSYVYAGAVEHSLYYRQTILQDGEWVNGQYYMLVLSIFEPTQFGGDYAYTGSGLVFTTSVEDLPINDTLLSGDGKYHVHLEQYELDGTFRAEGDYTSPDCENLSGKLPANI